MDTSIFIGKVKAPAEKDLTSELGNSYDLWKEIFNMVYSKYPAATHEWSFSGEKYGWSFRIKDKKRTIIYFLPRYKFFKVAFVFGQKAFEEIMHSHISAEIKKELESARVYAEGRGIRLDVHDKKIMKDISRLVDIKLAH